MRVLTTKKVLFPLATAALAGTLAVGSGADFSSSSGNTASSVTSGTLTQSNSKAGASILDLSNMKPGDSVYGQVVIKNTGSLGSIFSVTETDTSGFTSGVLTEKIEDITNPAAVATVYSGVFGSAGTKTLGTWAAGESHTYRVTVTLAQTATNTEQGKTATATFAWNGTQTSPTVTNVDTGAVTPAA